MIILLAGGFIWIVAFIMNPDVGEYSNKVIKQFIPFLLVVIMIGVFSNMSEMVVLLLASFIMLWQSIYLLRQVNEKISRNNPEHVKNNIP